MVTMGTMVIHRADYIWVLSEWKFFNNFWKKELDFCMAFCINAILKHYEKVQLYYFNAYVSVFYVSLSPFYVVSYENQKVTYS